MDQLLELTYAVDHLATNTGWAKNTTFWWFIIVQTVVHLIWGYWNKDTKHFLVYRSKVKVFTSITLMKPTSYWADFTLAADLAGCRTPIGRNVEVWCEGACNPHVTTPKNVKISTVALSSAWIETAFLCGENFDRSHPVQRRPLTRLQDFKFTQQIFICLTEMHIKMCLFHFLPIFSTVAGCPGDWALIHVFFVES